ncbi:MAG TPA: hydrogenase maturation nickel metallochaperone HypA [Thermoanaerobaculia bacterium]
MHEYSIVQSLVDSVAAAVGAREASVHRVDVSIGELAGVDCALLATAFEVFRAGTICEHAALQIDRIAALWECPRCHAAIIRGGFLRCPSCNEPARLAAGDEIVLQRIELEVS